MLNCPKFSIGSMVTIGDTGEIGKIIAFEATQIENDLGENKYIVKYYVRVEKRGGVYKYTEGHLSDVKTLSPDLVDPMDVFLADSLMLSWTSDPKRVKNTIKELLKVGGVENESKECDDCSL